MESHQLDRARFALDTHSLNHLKRLATKDPQGQLKAVATKFEAMFLNYMLKSMRQASFKSGLLDNKNVQFYRSIQDMQTAQSLAGKGMGLADMLVQQLSKQSQAIDPSTLDGTRGSDPDQNLSSTTAKGYPALAAALYDAPKALSVYADIAGSARQSGTVPAKASSGVASIQMTNSQPSGAASFIKHFAPMAHKAAKASGVFPLLILAQAALETGWGQYEIKNRDGSPSHNLFGIKATASWSGKKTDNLTHEFAQGQWKKVKNAFRSYSSYWDSFLDHAHLLGKAPRYASVRQAATPDQAAHALQAAGYATDPDYADKLVAVMGQINHMTVL